VECAVYKMFHNEHCQLDLKGKALEDGYHQWKASCDNALAMDSIYEKCLFHRGQPQVALLKCDQEVKDFQTVLKVNPSNVAAQKEIEHCHQQMKQRECKLKELYKSIFNSKSTK
ncbi:unnamed protein product, partial [Rotaria sp. Silwood1]